MKIISLFFLFLFPLTLRANDSYWLLCDDGGIALNLYRSGVKNIKTELVLMFGSSVFMGEHKKNLVLQSKTGSFKGNITLTNKDKNAAVNGYLFFGKENFPVNALLTCKVMGSYTN